MSRIGSWMELEPSWKNLRDKLGHLEKITKARSTQIRPEIEIQQEQQRETISRSGKNNQIANSDDLDNYERNTQETIEITTLLQEGINEYTPEQENPGIPINVPTEDEQFYVDINNIVQPTFNLLKDLFIFIYLLKILETFTSCTPFQRGAEG